VNKLSEGNKEDHKETKGNIIYQKKQITWSTFFIALKYSPVGETSATEFNKFSRGILTLSNLRTRVQSFWVHSFIWNSFFRCNLFENAYITRYGHYQLHLNQFCDHNQLFGCLDICFHLNPWFGQWMHAPLDCFHLYWAVKRL